MKRTFTFTCFNTVIILLLFAWSNFLAAQTKPPRYNNNETRAYVGYRNVVSSGGYYQPQLEYYVKMSDTTTNNTAYIVTLSSKLSTTPTANEVVTMATQASPPSNVLHRKVFAVEDDPASDTVQVPGINSGQVFTYIVIKNNYSQLFTDVKVSPVYFKQGGRKLGFYFYQEYLPANYVSQGGSGFPLLIFLHGAGEVTTSTPQVGTLGKVSVHGVPKRILVDNKSFDFIALSPQSPFIWNVAKLDEFIELVKTNYNVNESKIYLAGLSMGGFGTWHYAITHPEKLAAIVPISGGANNPYADSACKLINKPIWAFHDVNDHVVSTSKTKTIYNNVKSCGGDTSIVRLTLVTSKDTSGVILNRHQPAWDIAFSNNASPTSTDTREIWESKTGGFGSQDIYSWLLLHSLNIGLPTLPGRIEGENFSAQSGVTNLGSSQPGEGRYVGHIGTDDFMDYQVNVRQGGVFDLQFRVSRGSSGTGSFQVLSNTNVIDTIVVSNTGGWEVWVTKTIRGYLPSGNQVIKVKAIAGSWNLNWFEGVKIPGVVHNIPGRFEAENYATQTGVSRLGSAEDGDGRYLGNIGTGDFIDYNINVVQAGTYDLAFRVSRGSSGSGTFEVSAGTEIIDTITVTNTGGWETWTTKTIQANLKRGHQTLKLRALGGSWNLNWIEAQSVANQSTAGARLAGEEIGYPTRAVVFPNPSANTIHVNFTATHSSDAQVWIVNELGAVYNKKTYVKKGENHLEINIEHLSSGIYILQINQNRNRLLNQKVVISR